MDTDTSSHDSFDDPDEIPTTTGSISADFAEIITPLLNIDVDQPAPSALRHYLTVDDLQPQELVALLDLADELKAQRRDRASKAIRALSGLSVAVVLEKPSTRARISFEVGISELGATPVVLTDDQMRLGQGAAIGDMAKSLSRYVHAVVIRTYAQERIELVAEAGTVPVINGLSDSANPCQVLADLQTIREYKGRLEGIRLGFLGDGNNTAHSLIRAAALSGMHLTIATPQGYEPEAEVLDQACVLADMNGGSVTHTNDPNEACDDADVLYTDVWTSVGREHEAAVRRVDFADFQLNGGRLERAQPDVIVLHPMPAHRGEEITTDVLEGPAAVVFDQIENRLHTEKALLRTLLAADQTVEAL